MNKKKKARKDFLPVPAEVKAKRTVSDSVFTDLFRIPKYRLQLYQALHPEDSSMTEEKLRLVTLENILLNQPYNDLGILAEDHLLILVEAQSTWSENILVRILIYLAQTYQNYITETQQDVYSSSKLSLPVPEFYVLYTEPKKDRPESLFLSKAFFKGKKVDAEICVHMIYNGAPGDIIDQYVNFTRICKEQYRTHGRNRAAIQKAILLCKSQGILEEYLSSREKEVISIMDILFNQEYAVTMYAKGLERKAHAKGLSQGLEDGKTLTTLQLIQAKQKKNKSLETIAEEVEETPEAIRPLYLLAQSHPQYSAEKLLKLLKADAHK